jgi:hypothetical protein
MSTPDTERQTAEGKVLWRFGRDGFDAFPDVGGIYGGACQGPVFVLTHHPKTRSLPTA